jgi:hypothetical protein
MNEHRARTYAYRGVAPLWLLLAIAAPVGLVFLTSLLLALALAGVGAMLAAVALPAFRRRRRQEASNTIELDASQYHRIESRSSGDDA